MNTQRTTALRFAGLLGLAATCLLSTGCLYVGNTRHTEIHEAERIKVRFQSAQAAQEFQAGFDDSDEEAFTDTSAFGMPFLAAGGNHVYHETAHYNAQVRLADIDRDGTITDAEARAYRNHMAKVGKGDD